MSKPRPGRLGKGLSALLGDEALRPGRDDPGLQSLRRTAIVANPYQPRREFQEEELAELAESIRENGLLQPLVVRPDPEASSQYQLVAGERRFRAITRLGWARVPAVVRDVDDQALLVLALVENIQREELGPLEEAEGYRTLVEQFDLTQGEVAEMVGKNRSTVANLLRLLKLPPSVRRLLEEGALSMGHARALLSLEHPGRITQLARKAAAEGWSVREVEARTRKESPSQDENSGGMDPSPRASGSGRRDPAVEALEQALEGWLGTRVSLKAGSDGSGRIQIPFRSQEDFARIYELITGEDPSSVVG